MVTFSYGGGVQTIAIITLILEKKLPKPDIIVMADTGREVQTTFQYLNTIVQPAMKAIGLCVEIAGHEYSRHDLMKSEKILLPAFTRKNGGIGKLPTFCSDEWKQRVIRRWLRTQAVKDTDVWLGISFDEAERMKTSGLRWYRHVYPLIEMVPMTRSNCLAQIKAFGWEVPYKSRCYMCPNQSDAAWRDLKNRNDGDFQRAVQLENDIRQVDKDIYLHQSAIPLVEAVAQTERQLHLFDGCDSGYCFT